MNPRPLATREEVAAYLRVNPKTLDNWHRQGRGPVRHMPGGGSVRYRWEDVETWVETQQAQPETCSCTGS